MNDRIEDEAIVGTRRKREGERHTSARMSERGPPERLSIGFGHLPRRAIASLDHVRHGAHLSEWRRRAIVHAYMNAAPSMLSTCGEKRRDGFRDRSIVAVHRVDGDASNDEASVPSAALAGGVRLRHSVVARQPELLRSSETRRRPRRQAPRIRSDTTWTTRPGCKAGSKLPQTPRFKARSYGARVERARAPRGGRDHADPGRENVHIVRAMGIALKARPPIGDAPKARHDRGDLRRRRGHNQNAHWLRCPTRRRPAWPTMYGCVTRLTMIVSPKPTRTADATSPR